MIHHRLEEAQTVSELRESWDFSSLAAKNHPDQIPQLRECVSELSIELVKLSELIMRAIESALGMHIIIRYSS